VSEPVDPREQFGEHGEWDALAVGWALSALDPEDEDRFADHLPGCARCTATVRESLYTVADLAYALPDEAPPPVLKSRLMAAVAAEPRGAGLPAAAPAAESQESAEREDWPRSEPHPGTPAYGVDWFAKPSRAAGESDEDPGEWGIHQPPVGERRSAQQAGSDVDEPTVGVRRPQWLDQPAAGELDESARDAPVQRALPPDDRRWGDGSPAAGPAGGASAAGTAEGGAGHVDQPYRDPDAEPEQAEFPGQDAVVPLRPRRRWGRVAAAGVATAAVLALIAGLLVSNVRLRNEQDDLRQLVAQREAAIQQLTANGPARVAALTADGQPAPQRRATLVVRGDRIEIIVETLGATTGNETYWLWTLRCDTPKPTDLKPIRWFTVAQSEFSVRDIGSDPGVASAPCFAISSELGTATPKAPRQVVAVGQPE
jgi:hypothetical protein